MILLPGGGGYTFYPFSGLSTKDRLPPHLAPREPEATWRQYPLLHLSQRPLHEGGYWLTISRHSCVMRNTAFADSSRLTHAQGGTDESLGCCDGIAPKLAFDGDSLAQTNERAKSPSDTTRFGVDVRTGGAASCRCCNNGWRVIWRGYQNSSQRFLLCNTFLSTQRKGREDMRE